MLCRLLFAVPESPEPDGSESTWCLIGNIVAERPFGPGGVQTKRGTKHFAPGTKVYCLPPQWGDGFRQIRVLGKHRGQKGGLEEMVVSAAWVTDWRAKVVYSPDTVRRLTPDGRGSPWTEEWARDLAAQMLKREQDELPPAA